MKTLQINKMTNELTEMINLKLSENCRTFAFIKENENCKGLVWVVPAKKTDFTKFDNVNNIDEIIDTLKKDVVQFIEISSIKIAKEQNETSLKKMAIVLNVSYKKVLNCKNEIISKYNAPAYMIFGHNSKGKILYSVKRFAEILKINVVEIVKEKTTNKNDKYKEILKTEGKKAAWDFWLNN